MRLWHAWVRRDLWSRARGLGPFCLPRGAARARERREAVADVGEACCGAVLFVSCRPFCLEHNGQTVLSRICSSAVLIKKRCLKRHLRSAAATVKACTRFHSQELAILAKSRSSGASRAHQRPQAKIVAANLRTCRGAAPLPRSRATLRRSPGPRCAAQNLNIVRNCRRPIR